MCSESISRSFILSLTALFVSVLIPVGSCFAECIPGDDPCAPKKKIGEWDNSVAFGFNMTSGNSSTRLVTVLGNTYYEKDSDIVEGTLMYNFGEDRNVDDEKNGSTTRNDFRVLGQYNHLVTERTFLGFGSKFFYDEIADIDYRVFVSPSAGYYFLKDNTFKLRLEGGPSYVFERVGGLNDEYLAPRLANRFDWFITCTSKIYQTAEILGDTNDSQNFLVNAEVGIESALSTALSLVVLVRETFDNQPAEGRDKGDLAVISALKVAI